MQRFEHILIVDDDDAEIRTLLRDYLERNGLRATAVADGRAMRAALAAGRYDLVVLDLMLPGEDGLTLCRELRTQSNLPVVMLTARGEDVDRIVGLEMGADDYLSKPFNPRELLARIKAVLRRAHTLPPVAETAEARRLRFTGWTLELARRQLVSPDGVVVPLDERGGNLSTGQRQLLSLARTLAGEPKILILDEATAHVDSRTEAHVQRALAQLRGQITLIVIAHRLSTIQAADCILVLHHGTLTQQGTHAQLLVHDGVYRSLYQLQELEQRSHDLEKVGA